MKPGATTGALRVVLTRGEGEDETSFEVSIPYRYVPGRGVGYNRRGEPIDPPEPAEVEIYALQVTRVDDGAAVTLTPDELEDAESEIFDAEER